MQNKKWIIIVIVVALIAVIAGTAISNQSDDALALEGDSELVFESGTSVTVISPVNERIAEMVFTIGSIEPVATYNIFAKASGTVENTYFEVGDSVNVGDILFTIEDNAFNVTQNATLTQLQNGLEQAKSALETAENNLEDQKQLFENGAISETLLKSAQTGYDNAIIAYNNAKSNYESNVSQLKTQHDNYMEKSTVSGVVVAKNIKEGEFATSSNYYTIITDNHYVVKTSVASKYINRISEGQAAKIYVNTLDRSYTGTVKSVSEVAQAGAYPVEIELSGDEYLRAGLYAEVEIEINYVENAIVIPKSVVLYDGGVPYVYAVADNSVAARQNLTLGIENEDTIQVLSELPLDRKIIDEGKAFLDEGDTVVIK